MLDKPCCVTLQRRRSTSSLPPLSCRGRCFVLFLTVSRKRLEGFCMGYSYHGFDRRVEFQCIINMRETGLHHVIVYR